MNTVQNRSAIRNNPNLDISIKKPIPTLFVAECQLSASSTRATHDNRGRDLILEQVALFCLEIVQQVVDGSGRERVLPDPLNRVGASRPRAHIQHKPVVLDCAAVFELDFVFASDDALDTLLNVVGLAPCC
jgi:hypothetical protein